jgi:transposase-like protein
MASRGKRYSEEQIIAVLKEAAAGGSTVGEVIRRHGVSQRRRTTRGRRSTRGWTMRHGG